MGHDGSWVLLPGGWGGSWLKVEWMQRVSEMGLAKILHPKGLRQILQSKGVTGGPGNGLGRGKLFVLSILLVYHSLGVKHAKGE